MPKILNLKVSESGDSKKKIVFSQAAATPEELETVAVRAKKAAPETATKEEIERMGQKAIAAIPNPLSREVFFIARDEKKRQPAMLVIAVDRNETSEGIASLPAGTKIGYVAKDRKDPTDYIALFGRANIRHALHTLGEGEGTAGRTTVSPELAGRILQQAEFIL